jgi:hypothetical protein
MYVFLEDTRDDKLGKVAITGIIARAKVAGAYTRGMRLRADASDCVFHEADASGDRVIGVVLDDAVGGYARILFDGEGGMGTLIA